VHLLWIEELRTEHQSLVGGNLVRLGKVTRRAAPEVEAPYDLVSYPPGVLGGADT
jgi:hypothetical protein